MIKECERCGTCKAVEQFYKKDATRRDHWCKACRLEEKKFRYMRAQQWKGHVDERPTADTLLDDNKAPGDERAGGHASRHPSAGSAGLSETEFQQVLSFFRDLRQYRDEALAKSPVKGWRSHDGSRVTLEPQ